jgi:hypothetical protein
MIIVIIINQKLRLNKPVSASFNNLSKRLSSPLCPFFYNSPLFLAFCSVHCICRLKQIEAYTLKNRVGFEILRYGLQTEKDKIMI